jgi:hypothetical protein
MAEPAITSLTPAPTVTIPASTPFSLPPGPPQIDVIEALPPAAAEKLRLLRQRSEDSHAVIPPFEQVNQASIERVDAERSLARLTNHPQDFGLNLPEDHHTVVQAQKRLDKAKADLKRITELQATRTEAWHAVSGALSNVEAWLRHGRPQGVALQDFDVDVPKLNKGETVIEAVERVRRRGRELKADLHRIASAQYPSNYTKQKMREQITQLAERGAPDVTTLVEHDSKVEFQTQRLQSQVYNTEQRAVAFTEVTDAVALACWLHRDVLIARLEAEIDAESDDNGALTHEQRELRSAEVMGDLLAVERDEAALMWRAMDQRLPVEFRADINPIAVLGLKLVTVTNGHWLETSPGLSWVRR